MGVAAAATLVTVLLAIGGGPLLNGAFVPWGVLAVVVLADVVASRRSGFEFMQDVPGEVYVGDEAVIRLATMSAPAGISGQIDWPEGLSGQGDVVFDRRADGGAIARIAARATRRGLWRFESIWLSWPSRFELFEYVRRLPFTPEIRVVPNIRLVRSGQINTTVLSTLYGVKENRAIGEGSEFHQLREFVRGMDVKTIDWKRSARRRVLLAKELRAERNHHVILAIDTGYLMREEIGGLPKIDHAVTAALATAWAAALGGDLVGHYAYDVRPRSFARPEQGRSAFARMRRWAADLSYEARETNHTLALTELNARTPKRSLIIVFTDFIDTTSAELLIENIGILAKRHLIIFVAIRDAELESLVEEAPGSMDEMSVLIAANQTIAERRLVLERLTRLGVTVVDARPEQVTARLITTYLDIKERELI